MKKWSLVIFLVMFIIVLVGCSSESTNKKEAKSNIPTEFVIAYLPNEGSDTLATNARSDFSDALGKELGVPVKEIIATDYNAAVEAMRTGKAHMAFFGPLTFAIAYERAKALPLVALAPEGDKEKASYQSYFIVKKDSPIKNIKDIKGKKMGFVDPNSTSGNLVPSATIMESFAEEKLNMDKLHTNGEFFEAVIFTGSHAAQPQAVLKGDLDVAVMSSVSYASEIRKGNFTEGDIVIIHKSPPIPNSPLTIQGDIDEKIRGKIKDFMVKYDDSKYFKYRSGKDTTRFVPVTIDDYLPVMKLSKELNK